jgi:hypothetical protein
MRSALVTLALSASFATAVHGIAADTAPAQPIVATMPAQGTARQPASDGRDSVVDYTAAMTRLPGSPVKISPEQTVGDSISLAATSWGGAEQAFPTAALTPVSAPAPKADVPVTEPEPAQSGGDSIGAYVAPTAKGAVQPAPNSEVARAVSILPSRPEATEMHFSATPAAEVALRFAREYRVSVVFSGDGSTVITGWTPRTDSIEEMLRAVFTEPEWSVKTQAGTYLVTARPTLTFRHLTAADLNPPLDTKDVAK